VQRPSDAGDEMFVTANELAVRMGLPSAQAVLDLRRHHLAFPEPVGRRRRALVWSVYDVERWEIRREGSWDTNDNGAAWAARR